MLSAAGAAARGADVVSTWKNNGTGRWSDPARWTNAPAAGTFPHNGNLGHTFDVFGPSVSGGEITLDLHVALRDLRLSGGIIRGSDFYAYPHPATGTNTITVAGRFDFHSGAVAPKVSVLPGGSLVLHPGTSKAIGSLSVGGTLSFAPTPAQHVIRSMVFDARIEISSTGSFALTQPLSLISEVSGLTTGSFFNYGVIEQAAGASLAASHWGMLNNGTFRVNARVDVQEYHSQGGCLDLQSAESVFTTTSPRRSRLSGGLRLAPGAVVDIRGGSFAEPHEFGALAVTNAGTINVSGYTRFTSPLTLPGRVNLDGANAFKLTLDADVALTGPASVTGHTISGSGRLSATDLTLGTTTIEKAELHILAGGGARFAAAGANPLTLSNGGRFTIDGAVTLGGGTVSASGASILEVRAGGSLGVAPGALLLRGTSSGPTLRNAGLIDLDRAATTIDSLWSVENSGTIRVTGGTFQARGRSSNITGHLDFRQGATATLSDYRPLPIGPGGRLSLSTSARATVDQPVDNAGTIRLDGRSVDLYFLKPLTNSGRVELDDFATTRFYGLTMSGAASLLRVSGSASATYENYATDSLANAGTIHVERGGRFLVKFGGDTLSNAGTVRVTSGAVAEFGRFTNAGTLQIDGPGSTASFWTVVNLPGATFRVAASAAVNVPFPDGATFSNRGTVEIDSGARVRVLGNFRNTGSFRVSGGGVLTVNMASRVEDTGTIDLSSGAALLTLNAYSSVGDARARILSGYAGGAWTGTGITSTDARADSTTGVGYAAASNIAAATLAWLGSASNSGHVVVRHTKYGDADLSGGVDFTDLVRLAQNYGATNRAWSDGDFTYDGAVDFADLVKLAQNYGAAPPADVVAAAGGPGFAADLAAAFATVPEPGAFACASAGIAGAGLAGRRGRARRRIERS